jgi:hypothetical protein
MGTGVKRKLDNLLFTNIFICLKSIKMLHKKFLALIKSFLCLNNLYISLNSLHINGFDGIKSITIALNEFDF